LVGGVELLAVGGIEMLAGFWKEMITVHCIDLLVVD
jgi:hypothetical protein